METRVALRKIGVLGLLSLVAVGAIVILAAAETAPDLSLRSQNQRRLIDQPAAPAIPVLKKSTGEKEKEKEKKENRKLTITDKGKKVVVDSSSLMVVSLTDENGEIKKYWTLAEKNLPDKATLPSAEIVTITDLEGNATETYWRTLTTSVTITNDKGEIMDPWDNLLP